jgi:UDP-sugar transporter A1/2/3
MKSFIESETMSASRLKPPTSTSVPPETNATSPQPAAVDAFSLKTKLRCCAALLLFSVAATLLAEASKTSSGSYPYNTFVIPFSVEGVKLVSSACVVYFEKSNHEAKGGKSAFSFASFLLYCVPALCYFISNNCMFYIIRELGPTTFQITKNLKTLSTALLMRFVLSHKLTWTQVKALFLLACGSIVTQLHPASQPLRENTQGNFTSIGYVAVCVNSLAAGLGGVYSEKLLKGKATGRDESIHWQNCQLYFFGVVFGLLSILSQTGDKLGNIYDGFNGAAIGTVVALATSGLLVSFVLKYLDNFAKCFVNALTMIVVGVAHASTSGDVMQLPLVLGIVLTSIAIEQYNLS